MEISYSKQAEQYRTKVAPIIAKQLPLIADVSARARLFVARLHTDGVYLVIEGGAGMVYLDSELSPEAREFLRNAPKGAAAHFVRHERAN